MVSRESAYDSEEFRRLGAVLAALVSVHEEEMVSSCREVIDAAFSDSPARTVIETLLGRRRTADSARDSCEVRYRETVDPA